MPLNGSGTYQAPASSWNPAVSTTTINSTDWAALLADITTALSTALYKDGQQTPTANIPLGGFKITGLGLGTLVTDAARVSQVQNSSFTSLTAVAGTNTITATATPTPAAYVVGQQFTFTPSVTNTGATTLNVSSLGGGAVQWNGSALTGGELVANTPVAVIVSAVTPVFQIIAPTQFPDNRALVVGGTDATKKLRFEVDTITTGTTRVITVPDADITLPSTFPTSYSEGTWTPSVGGSATYTVQTGTYTRIGRMVQILGALTINVIGTGSTSTISGLPFTVLAGATASGVVPFWNSLATGVVYLGITAAGSGTSLVLTGLGVASGSITSPFGGLGNNSAITFAITYFV